jgi:flagellar M-ring protein FliF
MDFLKSQALKIREQLAGLTQSQRMLAGSLAVIMVMSLVWWSRYAATAEMEDVLPQDFSPEQITAVVTQVASRNIPYKVVGSRVQVATDRKFEALALLTYEQLMPQDTANGFDEIVQKMDSPWNTSDKQNVMFNRAKEATLAQIMREWPGIRDARVVINNTQRRSFGEANLTPTATVNLKLKTGFGAAAAAAKPTKQLVAAAADTVAGAVSGMARSKVNVIIDGASHHAADRDDPAGGGGTGGDTWMELVKEHERHFSQKIQERLRNIDGVLVSVTVDPNMQAKQIEKELFDKERSFSRPVTETERTEESNTNSRGPSEPGVVPNVSGGANQALAIGGGAAPAGSPAAGGAGESSSTSNTETTVKNENFVSKVRELIRSPAGASAVVGASVSIPRSHFLRIFKSVYPTAKDPDDATLKPIADAELLRIKNNVLGCVSQTPEDKVMIDPYYDYLPAGDVASQPAVATSIPLALAGHAKEIVLGALAVVSLFMVSSMVRKAAPAPIILPQSERAAPVAVAGGEDVAGEAGEGVQSMDAVEVDDAAVHTQQMIAQVSTLVKENPDAAANLVKRWLNRS